LSAAFWVRTRRATAVVDGSNAEPVSREAGGPEGMSAAASALANTTNIAPKNQAVRLTGAIREFRAIIIYPKRG